MITLYKGSAGQLDQDPDIIITSPESYVDARRAIRDALISGEDLCIQAIDMVMQNWFWDLEKCSDFQGLILDPRKELEHKLDVLLPEVITADVIEKLDLLNKEAPGETIVDVSQWIADKCLGKIWGEQEPDKEHLRNLIRWFVDKDISEISPELWVVIEERLRYWEECVSGALKDLYASVRLQPMDTINFLCANNALSTYPKKERTAWLERFRCLTLDRENITTELDDLPPNPTVNEELKGLVIPYWNHRLNKKLKEEMNVSQ